MKKIVIRIIGGFVIGMLIGQFVQLTISLGYGTYIPVMDHFQAYFPNLPVALVIQTILTGCIGVTFSLSALLFDIARWSLLKQYFVHFFMTSIVWIPTVILLWMPKTSVGTFIFIISYVSSYVITWISQMIASRKDIEQINAKIQSIQLESEENQ